MPAFPPQRRDFLRSAAQVAASAWTLGRAVPAEAARPAPDLRVRKDVARLAPNATELKALQAGVEAMRKKAAADPLGWARQARIHLDECPHGNWFFLPWHRAYLYFFEQICRAASKDDNFALPYWDWTKDRTIPASCWAGTLNDGTRKAAKTEKAVDEYVGGQVIQRILDTNDFITFAGGRANKLRPNDFPGAGQLEITPHNYIHNFVGGDMATFLSPLDPLFWLHHANVDRLWTEWVKRHPKGMPDDRAWLDAVPLPFFGPDGKAVAKKVRDVLSTYSLGYRYDTQPEKPTGEELLGGRTDEDKVLRTEATNSKALRPREVLAVSFDPSRSLRRELGSVSLLPAASLRRMRAAVRLSIEGIEPPKNLDVSVRAFVNCPELSAETPPKDPHYIGSFTFFGEGGHGAGRRSGEGGHGASHTRAVLFDMTDTLRSLAKRKMYDPDGPLKVQLVLLPLRPDSEVMGPLVAKNFRLAYVRQAEA